MKEPEKWCIKVTPENKKAIEKWRTANATLNGNGYCVNKNSFNSMIGYWYPDKPRGHTEISFEEFKVYTSKPKDLTGRYVKCLVDGAQGTKCKAGEIYKLVSLDNIVETQVYKLEDGFCLCLSPTTTDKWELLPEDYSANTPLKQAVHCKTQEEWDFVLSKFNPNKLQSNSWDVYTKESCFSLQENCERYGYTSVKHFKVDEVKILSFQEWCDLNGYKIEKEVKFEVGDWVVSLEKSISYNVNEICRVSKISKTHLACENKPQGEDYMKPSDKFRHATQEEINNYLISIGQIPIGEPLNTGIEPNKDGSYSYISVNRGENPQCTFNSIKINGQEILKPKMSLSVDDEELPMVNIIKTNTIKQLLNND